MTTPVTGDDICKRKGSANVGSSSRAGRRNLASVVEDVPAATKRWTIASAGPTNVDCEISSQGNSIAMSSFHKVPPDPSTNRNTAFALPTPPTKPFVRQTSSVRSKPPKMRLASSQLGPFPSLKPSNAQHRNAVMMENTSAAVIQDAHARRTMSRPKGVCSVHSAIMGATIECANSLLTVLVSLAIRRPICAVEQIPPLMSVPIHASRGLLPSHHLLLPLPPPKDGYPDAIWDFPRLWHRATKPTP